MRGLNLGCGPNLLGEGWLNADLHPIDARVLRLDATETFPFSAGEFDRVFTEHMIEHVSYEDGRFMLSECFRVLRPGGRIRVSTPGLEFLFGLLYRPDELTERYVEWACGAFSPGQPVRAETVINNFVRAWGHRYIYSRDALMESMHAAAFRKPYTCSIGESDDPAFVGLENAGRMPESFLQLETMTIEAEKP